MESSGYFERACQRSVSERKALEREIIEVSTAEQERIGNDIHDGIGQQLTALTMMAGGIERRLAGAGQAEEAAALAEMCRHLQSALDEARAVARGLSPVEIDPEGLADALSDLADRVMDSSGVDCRYIGSRQVSVQDGVLAVHLYRIAQEALHNAVKHGEPGRVDIDLQQDSQGLRLTVRDDGNGIDLERQRRGRLGLHIMRYRAGIIGARLTVCAAPAGGTLVLCQVPRGA
jgi:signal transduction histidine kinase